MSIYLSIYLWEPSDDNQVSVSFSIIISITFYETLLPKKITKIQRRIMSYN